MVSLLWHAASDGDLAKVQELVQTASTIDLEIKDHTGATPLIQAVKNGHVDVVHALLTAGADPHNGSSQGPPENHSSNPAILDALAAARAKIGPTTNGTQQPQPQQPQQPPPMVYEGYPPYDPSKAGYYPHLRYVPYPYMNGHVDGGAPPPPPPGAMHYYPPPFMPDQQQMSQQPLQPSPEDGSAHPTTPGSNLPPADIARSIPCRYFPSCRYGSACMFLHPQGPGPYYPGAMPPGQYPPGYDPMNPAQYPAYYPVPPAAFPHGAPPPPPPAHMVAMSPSSPHPSIGHQRSPSEQMMNPVAAQFSPNALPPPPPGTYAVPTPMSPPYPPNGHLVGPPPMHHPPHPHSPAAMYPIPPAQNGHPPHHHRSESYGSYPPPMSPVDQSQLPRSPTGHADVADGYGPPREGMYPRRGGNRRGSFSGGGGSRKPPCLFYPSGRCKNGDDCRFPHVLDGGNRPNGHSTYSSRYPPRNNRPAVPFSAMEEKMANLSVNGDAPNGHVRANGVNHSPDSPDVVNPTARFPPNGKHYFSPSPKRLNGGANSLTPPASKPQRVPSADEFPVLKGSTSPTSNGHIVNGTLNGGPTAAQILQGAKKGAISPRHTSPPLKMAKTLDADPQADHLPLPSHTVEA